MSLSINETFQVAASPDRVFAFLTNPAEVVTCLPGAELTETIDERTYGGRVKVKVGPITSSYAGRATLVEVDAAEARVKIVGEGKESGGPGSARMTMDGRVRALPDGGSEVSIDAVIDIVGRVMQFGRGLIESVTRQLFKQFVEAAQAKLGAPAPDPPPSPGPGATTDGIAGQSPGTGASDAAVTPAPNETPVGKMADDVRPSSTKDTARPTSDAPRATSPAPAGPTGGQAIAAGRDLHALPLLWKVFVSWLRGRFGRAR